MSLSLTTRWMLIVLTSAGLQLCCCNLKTLWADCRSNDGRMNIESFATAAHEGALCHVDHVACHADGCSCHGPAQGAQSPHKPCDQRQSGCPCGSHDKAPSPVGNSNLEIPAVAIAILPSPTISIGGHLKRATRYVESRSVLPPAMPLLRQHCALIL